MSQSSRMNFVTQHGQWRIRAHDDGRIEVEEFKPVPPGQGDSVVASVVHQHKSRVEAHYEAMERRNQWMWADANKSSEDEEVRRRARGILGLGEDVPVRPVPQLPPVTAETIEQMTDADLANLPEDYLRVVPEEKRPGLLARATSWLKAEASVVTQGALDDEAYKARIAACLGCEHLDRRDDPRVGFCKACGCGKNPRAELTVKGRMPAATCPKGKWPALPAK